MSPTILKIGPYRFFFNSREEIRRHLKPIVSLASYYSLSSRELKEIENIVMDHEDDFKSAWNKHFSQ